MDKLINAVLKNSLRLIASLLAKPLVNNDNKEEEKMKKNLRRIEAEYMKVRFHTHLQIL